MEGVGRMNKVIVILGIWMMGWLVVPLSGAADAVPGTEASVVVHFSTGKAYLGADDKSRLRKFFQKYETNLQSRIFVVGYTDSIGDKDRNYRLSRNRAQAIRREIISAFGVDATVVMALGKGEESPVADNRSASGRASNRRAEIYLANTRVRKPNREYGPKDPFFKEIQALVDEAETLIKQRQLGEAVKILKKARGMGGDHYSDWHAVYGIAGFYANAPRNETHAHLSTALKLDPYNYIAREYLSRITARQNVDSGAVSRHMGDSAAAAIPVTAVVQQHEYLRLFKVVPMSHRKVEGLPVDAWECMDEQGVSVTYYFDHSQVYGWAFAKPSAALKMDSASQQPVQTAPRESASSVARKVASPVQSVSEGPKRVWGSKVFK